jgi:hypothetical protein
MKVIEATQGKSVLVDDNDYEWLSQMSWHARWQGNRFYATTGIYDPASQKTHNISMHSFLMMPDKGEVVDHINGDSLDNRRTNLRVVTQKQNLRNKRGVLVTREMVRAALQQIEHESRLENDYGAMLGGARWLAGLLKLES